MLTFNRTNSSNPDFIVLVHQLDAELAEIDGDEHAFYAQYNKTDLIKHVVVTYEADNAVACGAIKQLKENTVEVKRMYVMQDFRGKGVASQLLFELEKWATEMNFSRCVLETGIRQPDAIHLYKKNGYSIIPNYGQYVGVENSRCFEKKLR